MTRQIFRSREHNRLRFEASLQEKEVGHLVDI